MDVFFHHKVPSPSQAIGSVLCNALTDAKGATVPNAMAIIVISNFIIHSFTSTTKFGLAVVILFMMYQFSLILHHDLMQAFQYAFYNLPRGSNQCRAGTALS